MNIELTKQEYRALLEVFQAADWVLNAGKVEDDPRTGKYRSLEQKVLSHAREAGLEGLVEYVPDEEMFFPTEQFEDESPVMELIEEYDDGVFWDQLAERMAYKHLVEAEGEKNVEKMPEDEQMDRMDDLSERYMEEFYRHGLDNVKLVT